MCIKYPTGLNNKCPQEEKSAAGTVLKNVGKYAIFSAFMFVILSITAYLIG